MAAERKQGKRHARRVSVVALLVALTLVALGLVLTNPVTGPELRAYIRDRFMKPCSRIPALDP